MANFTRADDPAHAKGLLFKDTFRVASSRLHSWDYSEPGFYHVTICTKGRQCCFGDIAEIEDEPGVIVRLSAVGRIVDACWHAIPDHYPSVSLDAFQIMPNHLHGIIVINVETPYMASLRTNQDTHTNHHPHHHHAEWKSGSLGSIVQQFKRACTHRIRQEGRFDFAWQPRFHDHVIRNEKDLERIQKYIVMNPVMWLAGEDEEQECERTRS